MALTYSIHHADRLVVAVVGGAFVRREVERYLADILATGCGPYAKLFDIVRAANPLDSEDMRALGSRIRILGAIGPMAPLAIVTSTTLRPVAEAFASYATAPRSIQLFDGEQAARHWLHATSLHATSLCAGALKRQPARYCRAFTSPTKNKPKEQSHD